MTVFYKDPNASLDYQVDWSSWLGEDTIASVTWVVASGITQGTTTNSTTTATTWLSGGTAGTDYEITCRITTAAGRVADRTFVVRVVER